MDIKASAFDLACSWFVMHGPVWLVLSGAILVAWMAARLAQHWARSLEFAEWPLAVNPCPQCQAQVPRGWLNWFLARGKCAACGYRSRSEAIVALCIVVLLVTHLWLVARVECQGLLEGGSLDWMHWRVLYQWTLLWLLCVATGIDFSQYEIPDSITLTGMLVGVIGATAIGHIQLVPVWVDWNQEIPGYRGAYIPDWIKFHPHWHGLAWSLAGLVVGGGLTWLVRISSALVLGREALGFGDVTLMAMIGSFVGWQASLLIFALAPLCGLAVAALVPFLTGKFHVPYGPYLSLSTFVVLATWSWLWRPLKFIFGHLPSIAGLAGGSLAALILLLTLWRVYQTLPVTVRKKQE